MAGLLQVSHPVLVLPAAHILHHRTLDEPQAIGMDVLDGLDAHGAVVVAALLYVKGAGLGGHVEHTPSFLDGGCTSTCS